MDSTQLFRFKVIAECGNMTRAANGLHISQPALSMMLKELEEELQCQLFTRQSNKLIITNDGKRLLNIAKSVCDAIESAEQEFKPGTSQCLELYSCDNYFNAILPDFGENVPSNFSLNVILNKDIPSFFSQSKSAGAVCDDYYFKHVNTSDFIKRFLFQEDLYLYVPEGHPWMGRNIIDISEINGAPLCYSHDDAFSDWVNETITLNKVKPKYMMTLDKALSTMYLNSLPYPRFISSRIAWNIENLSCKKSCFVQIRGAYTQRDICLWYHKQYYSNFRALIDGICARCVELNNYVICFREGIDFTNPGIKIRHYIS